MKLFLNSSYVNPLHSCIFLLGKRLVSPMWRDIHISGYHVAWISTRATRVRSAPTHLRKLREHECPTLSFEKLRLCVTSASNFSNWKFNKPGLIQIESKVGAMSLEKREQNRNCCREFQLLARSTRNILSFESALESLDNSLRNHPTSWGILHLHTIMFSSWPQTGCPTP